MKKIIIALCLLFFSLIAPAFAGEFDPAVSVSSTAVVLGAALAISEALSLIPQVKSNGIFQMIVSILKWFTRK